MRTTAVSAVAVARDSRTRSYARDMKAKRSRTEVQSLITRQYWTGNFNVKDMVASGIITHAEMNSIKEVQAPGIMRLFINKGQTITYTGLNQETHRSYDVSFTGNDKGEAHLYVNNEEAEVLAAAIKHDNMMMTAWKPQELTLEDIPNNTVIISL